MAELAFAGAGHRCHTCGTFKSGTKSGNMILDHQPVSVLLELSGLLGTVPQRLYPQWRRCSCRQGE